MKEIFIIKDEKVCYCDIDNTLVKHNDIITKNDSLISFNHNGSIQKLSPYLENIEQVKRLFEEGYTIICWSAGGGDWAKSVIETLNTHKLLDKSIISACLTKPTVYLDDIFFHQDYWGLVNKHKGRIQGL